MERHITYKSPKEIDPENEKILALMNEAIAEVLAKENSQKDHRNALAEQDRIL